MDGVGESVGAALGLSFAAQGSATRESARASQGSTSQGNSAQENSAPAPVEEGSEKTVLVSNTEPLGKAASIETKPTASPISQGSKTSETFQNSSQDPKKADEPAGESLQFQINNTALQYRFVETTPPESTSKKASDADSDSFAQKTAHAKQLVVVVVNEETGEVVRQIPPPPPKYFTDDEFKNKIRIGSQVDKKG